MDFNEVIKSVSNNQHKIIFDVMRLYNNGRPFDCDMTYSIGNFYGKFNIDGNEIEIPQPTYKFDVYPQTEDTVRIDPLGNLPLDDNSIDSMMIDLPFVITVGPSLNEDKKGQNIIAKRFSGYYPVIEMYKSYAHWIREAYRVLKKDGLLCFKTQATISGGINHDTPAFSKLCAMKCGFVNEDEFILTAKARLISGKVKQQQHARKFHSSFLVFRKSDSKKYHKLNYNTLVDYIYNSLNTQ